MRGRQTNRDRDETGILSFHQPGKKKRYFVFIMTWYSEEKDGESQGE